MKPLSRLGLSLLSGLLLYLAWPDRGLNFLIFGALLPWLFVIQPFWREKNEKRPLLKTFWYSWLAFALFNGATGWWISLAHWSGLGAVVFIAASIESLLMTLWVWVTRQIGEKRGLYAFPVFWIIHEWILNTWDLEWPWLKLGYSLADKASWIQWYSISGVFGGTLWIILVNLSLFLAIRKWRTNREAKSFIKPVLVLTLPLIYSLITYYSWEEQGEEIEIVVVQPNIEPYKEKFELSAAEQLDIFLKEASSSLTPTTDYLIGPETMLPNWNSKKRLKEEPLIRRIEAFRRNHPNDLHMVFGLNCVETYPLKETPTARLYRDGVTWYDVYNASVQLSNADSIPLYSKSKLVVGAEKMPYISVLQPLLGEIVIDFGGISGTNRTQENREVFFNDDGLVKAAPIICWEAEFGEFVSDYVQEGANIFFAITNDGWWGDSEGHRQHLHYARVRAIENRRSVARAANTGISAFINQRGDLLQTLGWEKRGSLNQSLRINEEKTIYTQFGNVLVRLSLLLFPLFVLYGLSRKLRKV